MNLLLIYTNQLSINYNKILIIKSFYRNLDLYENNNIKIDELNIYDINDFNFLDFSKYKNYIFWLHQKIGSYILTIPNYIDLIKKNNIKTIFWMDDLHYPCNNLTNEDRLDKELLNNDIRFNNTDLIVSPSIDYFYNINSKFVNKSKFLFYYFDENIINKYNPDNFDKRISKILLSGKINKLSYKSRKQMYTNYSNNNQLFDYLEHPGYKELRHNVYHNNFYNKLSEYKGAILGLGNYPINFLLAKIIEILGSGCVGFFEESELYFKRLNLIENIHYISIKKKDENNLILDNKKFKNIINSDFGRKISKNGYNFIKNNFNSKTLSKKIISILYEL